MDFRQTRFTFNRPINSYAKVQAFYSRLIRNKKMQLRKLSNKELKYLNVGCGANVNSKFINVDYLWRPSIELCWDITRGLPLDSDSIKGVFTEHCLEHITLSSCRKVLADLHRILESGGTLRVIVPDAGIYIGLYTQAINGEAVTFPYVSEQELVAGFSPIMAVNRVFREHEHLYAYDHDCLELMLKEAGFAQIQRRSFRDGRDPRLLIDSESREKESLYIEAVKS